MSDNIASRLASFRKSLGLSQRDFAASIGSSHATIAFVETGERDPSRALLRKLAEKHGLSSNWLLYGHGEVLSALSGTSSTGRRVIEPADQTRPYRGDVSFDGVEYAFARRMMLSVSAGNGLEPVEEGDAEGIAFPVAWLRRQQINADLAVLVSVRGDSMAPAIPDQALVLIHVAERSIAMPGIYAFNMDGESFVKRIIPQAAGPDGRPGAIAIISDNAAYPPKVLSGTEMNRIVIVGRVRAVVATI